MGKMKEKQGWFSLQGDKEKKTDSDGKFSQTQRGRGTKKVTGTSTPGEMYVAHSREVGEAESCLLHRSQQKVVSFVLKVNSAALSSGTL